MKPGDIYKLGNKIYMTIDVFDLEWRVTDDQGEVSSRKHVAHIKCMGADGLEEFPLAWFSKRAVPLDESR